MLRCCWTSQTSPAFRGPKAVPLCGHSLKGQTNRTPRQVGTCRVTVGREGRRETRLGGKDQGSGSFKVNRNPSTYILGPHAHNSIWMYDICAHRPLHIQFEGTAVTAALRNTNTPTPLSNMGMRRRSQ